MATNSALKSKRKTIKESMKKQESWAFTDTKCRVDKKIAFKRNALFQAFQSKEFQVILQDNPSRELSKGIYKNISRSTLHRAIVKTPVSPCPDVIQWMTRRLDHESKTILNL